MTIAALARLLNVRKEERWLVAKLFWIQFFQGAGVAFFFTSAYATFLNNHEVSDLSFVYIYTAILLWLTGLIYGKLEHKYHVSDFSRYIVWFMAGSILLIRIVGYSVPIPGFDYFILIWFNVLYLLSNLEFWGIAALVFEVRQSKRLFSIISAGEIPAKFIGYTLASLTVSYVGTANLLIPSFVCVLASLPFLHKIVKSGTLHEHAHHHFHGHEEEHGEGMIKTFIKKFTSDKLILWLAILSFIMSVCLVVANFSFYSKIKEAYHSDIELAIFIGSFLAVIRICALLVKLLLTSRLVASLGIKRSLLLTPIIFTGCIVMVILLRYVFHAEEAVLYMFGATCIVLDVLKTSINSPVFLSIMQPLPIHDRLRSHNIVKGIMDPFAYLFSGAFLFELIKIQHGINLTALSYFLLAFALCWIIGIFFVDKEYYATVLKAITSKFYNRSDLAIDDADTIAFIRKTLESGSELEIIHILRLIRFREDPVLNEVLIEKLLYHNSDGIKDEMLTLSQAGIINISAAAIQKMLADTTLALPLKRKAFSILCSKDADDATIFLHAQNNDDLIRSEALGKLLASPQSAYFANAGIIITDLIISDDEQNRITAAISIAKSKNEVFKDQLIQLINDPNSIVSNTAINASGNWPNEQLVIAILKHIKTKRNEVCHALLAAGPIALPYIAAYIISNEANYDERKQLLKVCGAIGGEISINTLTDIYNKLPEHAHTIIKAIYNCSQKTIVNNHIFLEAVAQKCIVEAAEILQMQHQLYSSHQQLKLLMDTLTIELDETRESLLYLFSILYKATEIENVRRTLALNSKEQTANAFEMLEISVPKKLSHDFIAIYEKGDIEQRVAMLYNKKNTVAKDTAEISSYILRSSETIFLDWSKSCAAYTLQKNKIPYDSALVKRYLYAENPVLKETANFTLNNVMNSKLLLLEKVLVLKRTAIFSETPEHILADLAPLMQEVEFKEGTQIFAENAIGDSMYIIYQGSVRIHKGTTTLTILDKENDVFGELSLFDAEKRSASATANTDCFLFKIEQLPFYELIETRPEIIKGAIKMLCKRLRAQNERTVEIQKENT
ncbi:cyclic nucleotide-binding domain-containing protein [Panacibacter ginsenosidivorans]|uniref:Cyclic nucleotide-binding domain-containing protein n=1 Tax=Panacibacter ginsenosidivorans TaxID=1813871 RepID=A0A5B8VBK2_9BACT|nr:cyclic nucleotide-binding domain-containing protein [Panacibacter ginsenosidivorans]QEC68383.1 cyclic nucleotide-binding domain-containing protein [Panacibacter ginsenosidivorans]